MKFFPWSILTGLLLVAWMAPAGRAAATVERACADAARAGSWEPLVVEFAAAAGSAGGEVSVRDARGGLTVARRVASWRINAAGRARVLMALPLVAPEDLPAGTWPVEVTVAPSGGSVEQARVDVPLHGGARGPMRILVPAESQDAPEWQNIALRPAVLVRLPAEELLSAPAQLLAGCDGVVLPRRLADQVSDRRTAALLNAGLQLMAPGDAPSTGPLAKLVWEQDAASRMHVCPHEALRPPSVIEPGLGRLEALRPAPRAARGVITAVLLVGPTALVVLLATRGLARRRGVILAGACVGLALMTVGFATYLRAAGAQESQRLGWEIRKAAAHETIGAVTMAETITTSSALFADHVQVAEGEPALLYPVAGSAQRYFALQARLSFSEQPGGVATRLEIAIPARGAVTYVVRRTAAAGVLPPAPQTADEAAQFQRLSQIDLSAGSWVEGGYVRDGASGTDKELFSRWAARQGEIAGALDAWYELRFEAASRYFVRRDPSAAGGVSIIDFGPGAGAASRP